MQFCVKKMCLNYIFDWYLLLVSIGYRAYHKKIQFHGNPVFIYKHYKQNVLYVTISFDKINYS